MKIQSTPLPLLMVYLLSLSACAQPLYHWGSYEDGLYEHYNDRSEAGQAAAFRMVEGTIKEAEESNAKVPPGVYAQYGYLLFTGGSIDKSIEALRREAELYPESKHLMESMISRIQDRQES